MFGGNTGFYPFEPGTGIRIEKYRKFYHIENKLKIRRLYKPSYFAVTLQIIPEMSQWRMLILRNDTAI